MASITWFSFWGEKKKSRFILPSVKITEGRTEMTVAFHTLAAAEDSVTVTDTSLLLAFCQWFDVDATLLPLPSSGLFSGKAKRKCGRLLFVDLLVYELMYTSRVIFAVTYLGWQCEV